MADMTKKKKLLWLSIAAAMLLAALSFGGYYAWKYYGLPSYPDRKNYETIEARADAAYKYAKIHDLNRKYALFVDYGIPSGTPRLFVWDFQKKRIIASTYVMHGPGMGSTAEKPVFSNKPGSNCSALGRFKVTKLHGHKLKKSLRLKGMDTDNQSAFVRGLMIHSSSYLDGHVWMKYVPLHAVSCQGCVTVTTRGMNYIWKLVNSEERPLLLWNYCSR